MMWRRLFPALVSLAAVMAGAQTNSVNVKVRLYGLHPQQQVRIVARAGALRWRTCAKCSSTEAKEITIRAAGSQVQTENVRAQQLFVEGDYRVEPQTGMKISFAAPLELRSEDGLLRLIASMP